MIIMSGRPRSEWLRYFHHSLENIFSVFIKTKSGLTSYCPPKYHKHFLWLFLPLMWYRMIIVNNYATFFLYLVLDDTGSDSRSGPSGSFCSNTPTVERCLVSGSPVPRTVVSGSYFDSIFGHSISSLNAHGIYIFYHLDGINKTFLCLSRSYF